MFVLIATLLLRSVGIMWSVCGTHDTAWAERSVFGKVRFMNYAGAKRKFDVPTLVDRYHHLGSVPQSQQWKANKAKALQRGNNRPETGSNSAEPANHAAPST